MSSYDEKRDGYRYSRLQEAGFILVGFVLGWVGVMIDWAIARRKGMMECSAEGIYLGIIGWAISVVCWFILTATGAMAPAASLAALVACGASAWLAGLAGVAFAVPNTLLGTAPIDGWAVFLLVVAILFIILSSMWVYGMRYKQTPAEKASVFPGDDWIKPGEKHLRYDAGVTIDAPAEHVWALVKQSGQTQAGWYSFDWLERLFTFDIHNHYDIHPEWQNLKPGDYQWFHQAPWSIGEWVTEVSDVAPYGWASHSDTATDPSYKNRGPNGEAALKLWFKRFCWTWNWQVVPIPQHEDGQCRLIWRCDCTFERYHRANKYFVVFILGTASIVMGRRYMDVMKALAEGRMTYPDSKK
ncbi:MAG: hypothetical protein IJ087_10900 [Eggerthellaceae bacterium]|nr:hypothetical protein [Eggerthellaceae bacterium]